MPDHTKVALEALAAYAEAAENISAGFAHARRSLVDADVTHDSFGLLAESNDIHKVYEERCDTGLDVLTAGRDVFADLADVFISMRDSYHQVDSSSAHRFGGH